MFTKAVNVVASKGYRMEVEFMPEWIYVEIKDSGHRVTRFTESPDTKLYEIGETILAQVCVYEYDLAQAMYEDNDPVEVEPVWLYYRVNVPQSVFNVGTPLHLIVKVEESDGRVMGARYQSDTDDYDPCPGCGEEHYAAPCSVFHGSQYVLNNGHWLPLSAPICEEYDDLLPPDPVALNLYKKV